MKPLLALMVIVAGMCSGSRGAGSDSPEARFASYGFPAAPGLTHLCGEHVTGTGMEITWDAFASAASVDESVAFYRARLGDAGMARDGRGATWRLPAGAARPERVLTVSDPSDEGPFRRCDGAALEKAHSIVTVSRAER